MEVRLLGTGGGSGRGAAGVCAGVGAGGGAGVVAGESELGIEVVGGAHVIPCGGIRRWEQGLFDRGSSAGLGAGIDVGLGVGIGAGV
eukprot:6392997-Pyramimonas_sp.AAC.1